jgi:phosphoribosyl 1,2-cyclic phosphate phosphodiesterase
VTDALEVTILGCGSSGGVPRADGNWGLCDPADPRNRRSRCSALIRRTAETPSEEWTSVVVDTAPDFRVQTSSAGLSRVDAVLYTHDHADQTHGIDDLRVFAMRMHRRVPCFMDAWTHQQLTTRFDYVFEGEMGYPAICEAHEIPAHGTAWSVDGPSGAIPVVTFDQEHGPIRSVGYRFGDVAYSSDISGLPADAMGALTGLKLWIVDALRWTPHPTHAHVERALAWIAELKPERAILTNLHVDLDYAQLAARLPAGVEPAYDGLRIAVPL